MRRVGITLVNCQGWDQDLLFRFQPDGITHDNVFYATVLGAARGNGRSGISVGGVSRVTIEFSVGNGTAQIRTEGFSETKLKNNDLIDDDLNAPALVSEGGKLNR